ncbi:MAG: hypothetical protein KA163_14390 [Bacteroidia bacterium]|nr:hypothetical protein [Bacteroidia bacterium]
MKGGKYISNFLILVFFALVLNVYAQQKTHTKKPVKSASTNNTKKEEGRTNLQFGVGVSGSVLYLSRNINEDNDALGYTINAVYGGHKSYRFSAQYTKYIPIDIAPTWYDVKANTIEANMEAIVLFKNNKTILYPMAGFSYNTFKGYFTGANDFLNLKEIYGRNTTVRENWLGLNIGTGVEHAFGPLVLFCDYKMRIGKDGRKAAFNIMDVCYSGGVRLKIWVPTFNKLYRGINDKYHWF